MNLGVVGRVIRRSLHLDIERGRPDSTSLSGRRDGSHGKLVSYGQLQRRGGVATAVTPPSHGSPDSQDHTSKLVTYFAFCSMNWRRGSTSSPISRSKRLLASTASSIVTRSTVRFSGSMVVSQS
jgi:hypothetical protein